MKISLWIRLGAILQDFLQYDKPRRAFDFLNDADTVMIHLKSYKDELFLHVLNLEFLQEKAKAAEGSSEKHIVFNRKEKAILRNISEKLMECLNKDLENYDDAILLNRTHVSKALRSFESRLKEEHRKAILNDTITCL